MQKRFSESAANYVKLTYDKRSRKHFGKCPFCGSQTEGFAINDKTGTFYCYICGENGTRSDFFSRLFRTNQLPQVTEHARHSEIYEEAAAFYYRNIKAGDNPARSYLFSRGLTDDTLDAFGLGYSPKAYNSLYSHLKGRYSDEELIASGLIREKENGFKYDFFRNRVMIPIFDSSGRVVAFGARALGDELPKYVNSAESNAFSKRTILYLYPYKKEVRNESIVICEGYMDAIAMQSSGLLDSCAVLGTALTKEHAMLVSRDYKNVILCLDSDTAGIHAAKKSIDILKSYKLTVHIPDLLPAKDPDEFIRKYGIAEFKKRLQNSVDAETFLLRHSNAAEIVDILIKRTK